MLFLVVMLLPFTGIGQSVIKKDSLEYYKFHAQAQFDMVGDYKTSILWLNKAIRLDPQDDELFFMRAFAKGLIEDFKGGEADLNIVIALDPGNFAAHSGRAGARFRLKKYQEAISDYTWLIDEDPKYYGYYINRALCKLVLQDKDGACMDFKTATNLGSREAYVIVIERCLE